MRVVVKIDTLLKLNNCNLRTIIRRLFISLIIDYLPEAVSLNELGSEDFP